MGVAMIAPDERGGAVPAAQWRDRQRWALRSPRPTRTQRGSIAMTSALFLLVGIIFVEALSLGFQFNTRRRMQSVADFSALAGAGALRGSDCTNALQAARGSAALNGNAVTLTVDCGNWSPSYSDAQHYRPQSADTIDPNAVRVAVTGQIPFVPSWMSTSTAYASAIATRNGGPVAVFSIASKLMDTQLHCTATPCPSAGNVQLVTLLKALGINAGPDISMSDLTTLLTGQTTTFAALLSALTAATGRSSLPSSVKVDAAVTGNLIPLLTTGSSARGLLTFDTSSGTTNAARGVLSAQVDVMDLLRTAVGIANRHHLLTLDASVAAPAGINARVSVAEPPSIGIGGVGATAYAAQIRVFAELSKSDVTSLASSPALTGLVATTKNIPNVDLPVEIDVIDARATLTSLCTANDASGADTATFAVNASLLQACIGNIDESAVQNGTSSCSSPGPPDSQQLLSLVTGLPSVNAGISLNALSISSSYSLSVGQSTITAANGLAIGSTVKQLTSALGSQIVASLLPSTAGSASTVTGTNLAAGLIPTLSAVTLQTGTAAVQAGMSALSALTSSATGASVLTPTQSNVLSALSSTVTTLATSVVSSLTNLLSGLLPGLGTCSPSSVGTAARLCLATSLSGTQSGANVSNSLLATLGAVAGLLQPALDAIGGYIASEISSLLGVDFGEADLRLMGVDCLGSDVRLVQ